MFVIAGKFQRRKLLSPKGSTTRPTASRLRETVFNMIQTEIVDANFLDLFAGSGAMGIEALSRGAKHATFIENNSQALNSLQTNLETLDILEQATILAGDFQQMLKKIERTHQQFDIIFADAPYQMTRNSTRISDLLIQWVDEKDLLRLDGYFLLEDNQSKTVQHPFQTLALDNTRRSGSAYLHLFKKEKRYADR